MSLSALALVLSASLSATPCAGGCRVAVHYFDNRTNQPDWDVLCKGVADMLVTDLAQVPGLTLVEREKLDAVVGELKLQHTQWFDPKSAQQVGRLLGANVVVTGQFLEVKPALAIEARAIEVGSGRVLATTRVSGPPSDFFALESRLANGLASELVRGATVSGSAPADADTALEYARALDAKDHGDLATASRRLGLVVRASPDFRLGKQRAAELVAFLAKASATHEDELAAVRRALEGRLLDRAAAGRLDAPCALVLVSALIASDLRKVVGEGLSEQGANVLTRAAARDAAPLLGRLEAIADGLRASSEKAPPAGLTGCRGTRQDEDDFASLGVKLPRPASLSVASIRSATVRLLAFGEVTPWSGVSFRVAPAPAASAVDPSMRDGARARVDAHLAALRETVSSDPAPMGDWTDLAGQVDVLFGRPDAAIEKWQAFLVKYQKAPKWDLIKQRLELLLGTAPAAADFVAALPGCGGPLRKGLSHEVQRVGWAEGAKGLERLVSKVEAACAKRPAADAKAARLELYRDVVSEAGFWSECALLEQVEKRLMALEPDEPHHVFADLCE